MSVSQQHLLGAALFQMLIKENEHSQGNSFQVVFLWYVWSGIYTAELSTEVEKWLSYGVGVYKSEFPSPSLGQGSILSVCITTYGPVVKVVTYWPIPVHNCIGPSLMTPWAIPQFHNQGDKPWFSWEPLETCSSTATSWLVHSDGFMSMPYPFLIISNIPLVLGITYTEREHSRVIVRSYYSCCH